MDGPLQQSLSFAPQPRTYSVSELASSLRSVLEVEFEDITVEGELSGFKRHRSGHCYFSLKDDDAQIRCVLWRHFTQYVFFEPSDGMLVRVRGKMSVYEARGDMQMVARSMRLAGEGALQAAFEALKQKLAAEGLFDAERKRDLPRLPERIGVITSGSGAALHDILSVIGRRYAPVEVVVCPVAVQGIGSAEQVARAIRTFNRRSSSGELPVDVLIVGRGGGSIEDLWAFNEEIVARALADSIIPTISAVGHETDYTIADYVADFRAATPSMAAEIVVPDQREMGAGIRGAVQRMTDCLRAGVEKRRRAVDFLVDSRAIHRPIDRMRQYAQRVDELSQRLERATRRCSKMRRSEITGLFDRLTLLNPDRPLEKGFVRIQLDGRPITSALELEIGDEATLHFADGTRGARVTE